MTATDVRMGSMQQNKDRDDIAIVGLSSLFPGAHTPDEFWQNLQQKKQLFHCLHN